jgi:DNA invertase Pin-like site-specific DNA recombinase
MAAQRGLEIVQEYTDRISGARARLPGLDSTMRDARRGRFDVALVWACDRIARSVLYPALAVIGAALFYAIRSQRRSRILISEIHDRIEHSC